MILPIFTHGNAVLRKIAEPITIDYPKINELIDNMFDTMYHAEGVGLAAPQIGLPIRVLVIDLFPLKEDNPELGDFKVAMINPQMLEMSDDEVEQEHPDDSVVFLVEHIDDVNMLQHLYSINRTPKLYNSYHH